MKLYELQTEVLWEGEIEGEQCEFVIEPLKEGLRQASMRTKGGFVKGLGDLAKKHPNVSAVAAGIAYSAYRKYQKNKKYTTRFYAKDTQEKRMYKKVVDDLMKTGHYKKVREKSVAGGYMWELERRR